MDKLEQFIAQNRATFDREVPSLKIWSEIDKQLSQPEAKQVRLWSRLRVAASIVVLLLAGGLAGAYLHETQSNNGNLSLAEIAPEFGEIEQYYAAEVDNRIEALTAYQHVHAVADDLRQLDAVAAELQQELLKAPKGSEELIINALIANYQAKLEILNRVLEKIQSTNQKSLNREGDEISI